MERPDVATIPDAPGSYLFRDGSGTVIYVGKARSLRSRLATYFQSPAGLSPKTAQMVAEAQRLEWIQVASDSEAVMLEYSLIKEHRPRYNIHLRDDKSYPYIAVTTQQEWARPSLVRGARKKGTRYFGPYANAGSTREVLDVLVRCFPLRTCSDAKFGRHERLGRPCLLFHIDRCSGPCIGAIGRDEYGTLVSELCAFLDGDSAGVLAGLEGEMARASESLEFEKAARLRDRIERARAAGERQQMVTTSEESFDIVGLFESELEASVQIFHVRRGRVVGRWGFVLDRADGSGAGTVVAHALSVAYSESRRTPPPVVFVPAMPADRGAYEAWLAGLRGGRVVLRVPHRGEKKALQETVTLNAREELKRAALRRGSDHKIRTDALEGLRRALDLEHPPMRIECYDMSHIQGTDYVGSMVVLEDGLPHRKDYRHFRVRSVPGNDDYAAMREVLERRLARLGPDADSSTSFGRTPDLILVDGGKGQLNVAVSVLGDYEGAAPIAVAALAKRFEQVYVPGRPDPVELERGSDALHLLQSVRDEAHRFAVGYHRTLRGRRMVASALDGVAGLGPARTARLLEEIGGIAAVYAATREDLGRLSWLPDQVARAILEKLHGGGAGRE